MPPIQSIFASRREMISGVTDSKGIYVLLMLLNVKLEIKNADSAFWLSESQFQSVLINLTRSYDANFSYPPLRTCNKLGINMSDCWYGPQADTEEPGWAVVTITFPEGGAGEVLHPFSSHSSPGRASQRDMILKHFLIKIERSTLSFFVPPSSQLFDKYT